MVRGKLIQSPGELTTRTAYLTTLKILWNSIISMKYAQFIALNVGHFYLEIPMDGYEYMKIPLSLFPQHTIDQCNLIENAKEAFV